MEPGSKNWEDQTGRLSAAFRRYIETCSALSPAAAERGGAYGSWSPRQVCAHISGWNIEAARRCCELLEDPHSKEPGYDIDDFNARSVTERQALDWTQTLAGLQASFNTFLGTLAGLTENDRLASAEFQFWAKIMAEEYENHGSQLAGES